MNDNFKKYGFYIIKNFISPDRSKKLSDEFIDFCNQNPSECRDDDQVKGSPSKYNFTPFLELLCEKNTEVSKIIGEPVLPTYSYARFYKKDAILEKHTDRESCEISLTIHLDGDKDWKFYIEDSNGKENKIILNPGDAILYSGTILPHWRKKFKGKSYTQVFLHYVKSNGKYKDSYFESPQLSIKNYIITIENAIPHDLCDTILKEYKDSNEWRPSLVGNGKGILDTNIRNCDLIGLSNFKKDQPIRKKIDDDLYHYIAKIGKKYTSKIGLNTNIIEKDCGYDLLRYKKNGFYIQHVDSRFDSRRLTCSLLLNNNYEGGEFAFFDRKLIYKLKKGSALLFPSNFIYEHEILPITKGTRYTVITWFI